MKRIVLYILILSYAIILLKPVIPMISDAVAHTFWRMEHISSTHFENGKYHVHFELLQSSKQTDKAIADSKVDFFATPHIVTSQLSYQFGSTMAVSNTYGVLCLYFPNIFIQGHYPPPKA